MSREKCKQRAKERARNRRDTQSDLLKNLEALLPVDTSYQKKSKHVQILRMCLAIIQLYELKEQGLTPDNLSLHHQLMCEFSILETLNGFFIIVSSSGDIIFISKNITDIFGIKQNELIGSSLYDHIHPCDVTEVRVHITASTKATFNNIQFSCRFKSPRWNTPTTSQKNAPHKVIQFTGKRLSVQRSVYILALCEAIPHPSYIEIPLDQSTFISKHNPKMQFIYFDERMKDLIGYEEKDVLDQSVYDFHHASDHHIIHKAYKDLFSKGQCVSEMYRFLAKFGGYVSVISQSTLIYEDNSQHPIFIISVYFVLSGIQHKDLLLSHVQKHPHKFTNQSVTRSKELSNLSANGSDLLRANLTIDSPINQSSITPDSANKSILQPSLEQTKIHKLKSRAPSLPKGQDVKLWSKVPRYGIFGGMKLPVGATSSVIMQTKSTSPCIEAKSGQLPEIKQFQSPPMLDEFLLSEKYPSSMSSATCAMQVTSNLVHDSVTALPSLQLAFEQSKNLPVTHSKSNVTQGTTKISADYTTIPALQTVPRQTVSSPVKSPNGMSVTVRQNGIDRTHKKTLNPSTQLHETASNGKPVSSLSTLKHILLHGTKPPRIDKLQQLPNSANVIDEENSKSSNILSTSCSPHYFDSVSASVKLPLSRTSEKVRLIELKKYDADARSCAFPKPPMHPFLSTVNRPNDSTPIYQLPNDPKQNVSIATCDFQNADILLSADYEILSPTLSDLVFDNDDLFFDILHDL